MSDIPVHQPSNLTKEQYRKKLASEKIWDKFEAIQYEILHMEPESWSYLRLVAYLEWFFRKVIEKKIPNKKEQEKSLRLPFEKKMKLMKKYELLIEDNYDDVYLIKEIRNEIGHSLSYDQSKIDERLRNELKRYNAEEFKELHPFYKCLHIVIEVMSEITNAIHTNFQYKPTSKSEIKRKK